jgi:hypothetical protein
VDESAVTPAVPDSAGVFADLAKMLYSGTEAAEVYSAICVAATVLVPGCDRASVMLRQGQKHSTVAATDEVAQRIDEFERRLGQGPCVDAIVDTRPQIDTDLGGPSTWPDLARAIVETTPVRGAMGFRLLIDERKAGALNLFSDTPGAFDAAAAGAASVLASFTSVTITAISRGDDVESLRNGLASNREIGQAIGLLMAMENISSDEAFDMLRRTSQEVNLKIADLARALVSSHASGKTE